MGSTALDLVGALPWVSCAPLGMFCALGDGMCLSRASASASVNEEHGCDAEGETQSTDPDLLVLREPVEGDDKQEAFWLWCSGSGCVV